MSGLRFIGVLFVLSVILSSVSVLGIKAADVEIMALLSVVEVEEAVFEGYGAVLDAEEAGADVSGLLDRLNIAGEYLALAKMCMRIGNLESAVGNASLSVEGLEGIVEDAKILKDRSIKEADEHFSFTITASVVGVTAVLCCSWLGWNWFKKRYYERALKMRPEVVEGES